MKKLILILILFITSCYQADDHYLREEATEIMVEDFTKAEYKPRIAKYLVIHCIATDPASPWTVERLKIFFSRELKWARYGYNYYITQDGTIWDLTPINEDIYVDYDELTYGVSGWNSQIWGISLEGGVKRVGNKLAIEDNFTEEQRLSLIYLTQKIKGFHPTVEIIGHNELNNRKACPVLSIEFLKKGIPYTY
jgi:N-acetylmuramoyl-L-alanine amidase